MTLSDDQRNQLHELRFEACENGPSCVHTDDPYSERGTNWHYDTCPANPDYDPCEDEPFQMCECELDWNCPLHQGGPTAIERMNDAWASEQTEIDRRYGM